MYVNSGGVWTQVPQEPNRVYCNNGNVWTSAKEVWVAEEVTPGTYQWSRAWRVPDPPAGVKPDLEQWDGGVAVLIGGDVRASWINSTTEYGINVEWEINSVSFDTVSRSAGSTDAILDRTNVVIGDEVRARMRYFEGSVVGTWSAWSDTLTYVDF